MTPGVDSFLTMWRMNKLKYDKIYDIHRVYFNLSSMYSRIEIEILKYHYNKTFQLDNRLSLGDLEGKDAHIPQRNLLLATLAQAKYDADVVLLNGVKDDRVSDNNTDFYKSASEILSMTAGKEVEVCSLLAEKEKSEWVRDWCKESNKHNKSKIVTKTFSCFHSFKNSGLFSFQSHDTYSKKDGTFSKDQELNFNACLRCSACFRKMCAMTAAGIYIPMQNTTISDKYESKIPEMEKTLPNRAKTVRDYCDFMDWFSR